MSRENKELYEFGDFRLDVAERKLCRLSGKMNGLLPEKAFQTLVYLIRNSGTLVGKQELLSAVWPDTIVEENNLGKAIHAIRQHLGEKGGANSYIETVPKHGYRFIAEVKRIEIDKEDNAPFVSSSVESKHSATGQPSNMQAETLPAGRSNSYSFAVIAAIVVIAAAGLWLAIKWQQGSVPNESAVSNIAESRSPAHDLYLRGKVKIANENRTDTIEAIKILEDAVTVDPNLAEAYTLLARGYNTMAFKYSTGDERKKYHENAEIAIEKALDLNPNMAEVHFARGLILWSNTRGFPHEKAIQSYKRSLALDPGQHETWHQLSLVYSHIGLLDEASQAVEKALEINPDNTLARFRAGVYVAYKGRFDEAISIFKTVPRDFTTLLVDRSMAEALIQSGQLAEAERITDKYLREFPQDEGGSFTSLRALLLARAGKENEAENAIAQAIEIGSGYGHYHHTAYNIASAYAAMNRPEEAVKWLEYAADNGFPNYPYFDVDPNLDNIRRHPRFVEFMAKLKPQWERFENEFGGSNAYPAG
jgi:DNA-binding winged helix-turn-helix (wHTH) protein/tetratricopeptide (TPR) repeat protein